jgi:hypothetical protein
VVQPKTRTNPLNRRVGDAAEEHAIAEAKNKGYTTILTVKNRSGHGVDLVMYNPVTRQYIVAEIKANSSTPSPDQRLGATFAIDRLRRAADGEGSWAPTPGIDRQTAEKTLQELLANEPREDIHFLVIRYDVDHSTLAVSNPGHAMWTRADPEHTDAAPGDTYDHLLRLDGPPEFELGPWEPGDGIP